MKKPRILSVDDETSFTDLLKQYFEPRGYEIDVTSSGAEGIRLLNQKKYDVILLDLKMAGINGEEVMDEAKRLDAGVKVIFITAFSDSGKSKKQLLDKGAYGFVEKPLTSLKGLEDLVNKAAEAA